MVRIQTITLDHKIYSLGFKVVTTNLRSLGLRQNPNILQYKIGQWYVLPAEQIQDGNNDWGGIWAARTMSGAKMLQKYMEKKYDHKTRIFRTALDEIIFSNQYRIKTKGINLVEEAF